MKEFYISQNGLIIKPYKKDKLETAVNDYVSIHNRIKILAHTHLELTATKK